MALCFKMILINQLHNHNQNALVSLFPPSFPRITAEQRGWSVRPARERQPLETEPGCGEGARGRVRASAQTCAPPRATAAGCGSHHKPSLCHSAGEQTTRAGERTSKGSFAAGNGQAVCKARVGTSLQEPGPFLSRNVPIRAGRRSERESEPGSICKERSHPHGGGRSGKRQGLVSPRREQTCWGGMLRPRSSARSWLRGRCSFSSSSKSHWAWTAGGAEALGCPGFPFGAPRGTKSHRFPCQREPGGENNKKQKARGGAGWSRADAEDGINQLSGRNIRALRLVVNAFSSFPKTDTMRDQGTFPIVTGDLSTRSSPMWKSLPAGSGRYLAQNMQLDGMGEGNGEKVERPEMLCPCLIDLGISRETVTIAAQLPVRGSLRYEVFCLISPLGLSQSPECSCEKPSRVAQRQQEWIRNFTAATERGREGTVTSRFSFPCLQPSLDRKPKSGCSNSCTKHEVKS